MPYSNICTTGYDCKKCPDPSVIDTPCDPWGTEDTTCKCPAGFFLANKMTDLCRPEPRCDAGFEPRPGVGDAAGIERICKQCGDGFYQPNDNSTDMCRKYTDCTKTPGTKTLDNVCKSDPASPFSFISVNASPHNVSTTPIPDSAEMKTEVPVTTNDNILDSAEMKTEVPVTTNDNTSVDDKTGPTTTDPKSLIILTRWELLSVVLLGVLLGVFLGIVVTYLCITKRKDAHPKEDTSSSSLPMRTSSGSSGSSENEVLSDEENRRAINRGIPDGNTSQGRQEIKRKTKKRKSKSNCCIL